MRAPREETDDEDGFENSRPSCEGLFPAEEENDQLSSALELFRQLTIAVSVGSSGRGASAANQLLRLLVHGSRIVHGNDRSVLMRSQKRISAPSG